MEAELPGLKLDAKLGEDGIIYLTIDGCVALENKAAFVAWAEKVKTLASSVAAKTPDRVLTLVDATNVAQFDIRMSDVVYDLLKQNEALATRTAMFGTNDIARMALDAIVGMARRTNFKIFADREGALAWLHGIA